MLRSRWRRQKGMLLSVSCMHRSPACTLPPWEQEEFGRADLSFGKKLKRRWSRIITVIWDTSKILLISEFLCWLQILGYLIMPEKTSSGSAMCDAEAQMSQGPTPLSPRAFYDTCPKLSAAWPALPESPEEVQLGQNCTSANFPTLVPPADSQHSMRGGMNEYEGKRAGPGASVVGPSLGVSSAGDADPGLLCSCCFSAPSLQGFLMFRCSVFLRYWAGSKWSTNPAVHQVDAKSKNNLLWAILCYTNISQNRNCDLILNI